MSPLRVLLIVLAGAALVWVTVVLALSTVFASPTDDGGEGTVPGRTITSPNP